MRSYRVKNDAGETFEVDEDKISAAEADGYLPVVSNGRESHRVSFSELNKAVADGYKPWNELAADGEAEATRMADVKNEYDKPLGVAVRSVTRGASAGFSDEIGGGLGAIADQIKGTDKTFSESYEENRDNERRKQRVDDINHPTATTMGKIGGGLATGLLIPGAATFAGSVGYGAAQGLGESEEEDALGMIEDTAIGAGMGAAGYGAGKVIQKIPGAYNASKKVLDDLGPKTDHLNKAFKEGTKKESVINHAPEWTGIPFLNRLKNGGVAAFKENKEMRGVSKEMDDTLSALQKTFGPGSATDLTDNDILMQKLLEQGIADQPNAAHRLVASKFASVHGGDANQYLALLKRSPEELSAAQSFNAIEAGQELSPNVDDAFQSVRRAANDQYGNLKEAARNQFPKQNTSPVRIVSEAIQDATQYKSISGNTRAVLDDTFADLAGREGQLSFTQLNPQEQFDRILEAKQRLGKAVRWASKNELPEGQQILQKTYGQFQTLLQSLDDMAAADAGYSGFKKLETDLFKKLGTVERGKIKEFDPIKLEKLFSGSASGRGLLSQVEKAREMLNGGRLPPEAAASVQRLLDQIDDMAGKASLKREMSAFRYGDAGPSSPAMQRTAAVAGKDSATTSAVRAPQLFLKMKAAAEPSAKSIYGKSWGQLNPQEQAVVSKYAMWISQNEGVGDTEIKRKIAELLAGAKKP